MKKAVSIIVPVYNTALYLNECLESLKNQTLKNIEIICVNDGSTDDSKKIIENFVRNDSRFKLINQTNQGLSCARNTGIIAANGEYIGFVDSDDFVHHNMFEKLYENAKKYDSDITMCSITMYDDNTKELNCHDPYMTLNLFSQNFDDKAFDYRQTLDFIFRICVTAWNKIYKTDFLYLNRLKFVEGLYFEDNVFFLDSFTSAKKVSLTREPFYFYRYTSQTSCSHTSKHDKKKLDFFKVFELEEKILKDKDIYESVKDYFHTSKKNTLIYWYKKIENDKIKQEFKKRFEQIYGSTKDLC